MMRRVGLRIAVPFFPGWTASIGNHNLEIGRAITLRMAFQYRWNGHRELAIPLPLVPGGAVISALSLMVLVVFLIRKCKQN